MKQRRKGKSPRPQTPLGVLTRQLSKCLQKGSVPPVLLTPVSHLTHSTSGYRFWLCGLDFPPLSITPTSPQPTVL